MDQPPNLAEVQIRAEIEDEVRQEYATRYELEEAGQRDKRILALFITVTFGLSIGLPILGLTAGLGVRAFLWASGL